MSQIENEKNIKNLLISIRKKVLGAIKSCISQL